MFVAVNDNKREFKWLKNIKVSLSSISLRKTVSAVATHENANYQYVIVIYVNFTNFTHDKNDYQQ